MDVTDAVVSSSGACSNWLAAHTLLHGGRVERETGGAGDEGGTIVQMCWQFQQLLLSLQGTHS